MKLNKCCQKAYDGKIKQIERVDQMMRCSSGFVCQECGFTYLIGVYSGLRKVKREPQHRIGANILIVSNEAKVIKAKVVQVYYGAAEGYTYKVSTPRKGVIGTYLSRGIYNEFSVANGINITLKTLLVRKTSLECSIKGLEREIKGVEKMASKNNKLIVAAKSALEKFSPKKKASKKKKKTKAKRKAKVKPGRNKCIDMPF